MSKTAVDTRIHDEIAADMMRFEYDPYRWVMYTYPWGEPGGPLEREDGPDTWQKRFLDLLGEKSREGREQGKPVQIAVKSGHGVGKSATVSWVIQWFMSTRRHPQIICTANTEKQLTTKTWREVAKWHNMAINHDWFNWAATKFASVDHPETWFASAIPWSERNSEAFAGAHDENVLVLFDEASAVPDIIWQVASGAMTTPGAVWLVFGNPTRNTGMFRECWGKHRHRWAGFTVDSREAKKANREWCDQLIEDYGLDSDYVRVRVLGEFPRAAVDQFIPLDLVEAAMERQVAPREVSGFPVILGVDVAYMGDDQSVICVRQGRKVHELRKYREVNGIDLAGLVCRAQDEWNADAVFVDEAGVGVSCCDQLDALQRPIIRVNAGRSASDKQHWANLRAEMWGNTRAWLETGCLPRDEELRDDLIGPVYGYTSANAIQLERKKDMKSRGLASPDCADALALTFAYPVGPKIPRNDYYDYFHEHDDRRSLGGFDPVTGY